MVRFQLCCEVHLDGLPSHSHLHLQEQIFPIILHCTSLINTYYKAAVAFPLTDISPALSAKLLLSHNALPLVYHRLCDTGEQQHLAFVSFLPHFILSSTLVLPCPRPLILLVLCSGIISSQLQEDSTSCAPAHHHQASYLCDSPEQYRVHPRCLSGGQASTGRSVDHGQPRTSHLQLHGLRGQPGQHQGSHHGHGVSSRQEACIYGQPHFRPDMR